MEKEEKYKLLVKQIRSLVEGETNAIGVMANVCAAIHETMGFFWTGFYRVENGELLLGPFQGPVACMRIRLGRIGRAPRVGGCARRRAVPWPCRLQQSLTFRDCRASVLCRW